MHIAFRRLFSAFLKAANNILPDPDGKPRPPTEAELARRASPSFHPPWKKRLLNYRMEKEHLSRIFRLKSGFYIDEIDSKGDEVRVLAHYPPGTSTDRYHGFGNTRAWHQYKSLTIYTNLMKRGPMGHVRGFVTTVLNTVKNIPNALIHAKTPNAFLSKAARHEPGARKSELAIIGRMPIISDDPHKMVFSIRADFMDGEENDDIILREIFMPVVDVEGKVIRQNQINPRAHDAEIETLRFLIFCKLVTDQMASDIQVDIGENLQIAARLSLDETSRLQDYLTFTPRREKRSPDV